MAITKIEIHRNIAQNDSRIIYAVNTINSSTPGDTIRIHFHENIGGSVQDALDLIDAIESSDAEVKIILVFKNYAVSAAAFIMCYFGFYNVVTPNITVQLDGNVCVVYHKPRAESNIHTYFASNLFSHKYALYPKILQFIIDMTPTFDDVFESMLNGCQQKSIRIAPHMKSVYNINGDVSVIFKGGPL